MMELRPYQQELVNKIRKSICSGKHSVCAVLGCGGGKSCIEGIIAQSATARQNQVLFLVHRKELCDQIRDTFTECGVDFNYCDIYMVQTACRRINNIKRPTLIITDECHHSLAHSYRKIYEAFSDATMVGFTATPARMNEGGLGAVFDDLIESVSTEWLIDNHYLAPYKYFGVQLADASSLHTKNGDFDKHEVAELMDKSAIFGSTVENWFKLAKGKQTIVYCASIKTSEATAEEFNKAGIVACHLDGNTPKKVREDAVEDFRQGEIKVLCNVDLFGEGFDVPDCEAVVLLRPTKSLTLHIQQSMRPMRYKPGKTAIILDHVGNFTRHGLPDDTREWSLASAKKKKKSLVAIKQCPKCFRVLKSGLQECPYCGFKFLIDERAEQERIEGIFLKEISKMPYSDYKRCKTWRELELFRKGKKYKFYWSLHKAFELKIPIPPQYRWTAYKMGLVN